MPTLQSARWTFSRVFRRPQRVRSLRCGRRCAQLVVLNTPIDVIDEQRSVTCDDVDCRRLASSDQRWG